MIILSVLLYVLIVIVTDFKEFLTEIQNIDLSYLPMILSIILVSISIRSIRQRIMLQDLGISISLFESWKLFIAGLSMLITPGGSGELIKSHFLKRNHNESLSKTMPYVFVERFHDFLSIVVLLLITIIFVWQLESIIIVLIGLGILTVILVSITNKKFLFWLQSKLERIKFFKKIF